MLELPRSVVYISNCSGLTEKEEKVKDEYQKIARLVELGISIIDEDAVKLYL